MLNLSPRLKVYLKAISYVGADWGIGLLILSSILLAAAAGLWLLFNHPILFFVTVVVVLFVRAVRDAVRHL